MPDEASSTVKTSRNRLSPLWILLALCSAGLGLWIWIAHPGTSSAGSTPVAPVESTLHLETFVLNLADTDQRSYLRVGIELGLNQDAKHAEETVPIAKVRDTILSVLGEARVADLMTSAGKTKLKRDLLRALQERVPRLGAEQVYFTEFLIQR